MAYSFLTELNDLIEPLPPSKLFMKDFTAKSIVLTFQALLFVIIGKCGACGLISFEPCRFCKEFKCGKRKGIIMWQFKYPMIKTPRILLF